MLGEFTLWYWRLVLSPTPACHWLTLIASVPPLAVVRVCLLAVLFAVTIPHTMQLLTDNIADSWMLLPALLCFFTPSFITSFGCVYAGLVVPSLNSIKVRTAAPFATN